MAVYKEKKVKGTIKQNTGIKIKVKLVQD